MAYNKGSIKGSVRYHFYSSEEAWRFAKDMVSYGRKVVDFGKDENRRIDKYYVDIA